MANASLQSDGRLLLRVNDRNYWFTEIGNTETEPRVSEEYADGQTGKIHTKTIAERFNPVTLRKPFDPIEDQPLFTYCVSTPANRRVAELSEKIGDSEIGEVTTVFRECRIRKYARQGTNLLANSARYLDLEIEFEGID